MAGQEGLERLARTRKTAIPGPAQSGAGRGFLPRVPRREAAERCHSAARQSVGRGV